MKYAWLVLLFACAAPTPQPRRGENVPPQQMTTNNLPPPVENARVAKLSVSDARYLFVAPAPTRASAQALFKISSAGAVSPVEAFDDAGSVVTAPPSPTSVFNLSSHVIVKLDNGSAWLVQKSTGATFDLADAGIPDYPQQSYINAPLAQEDAAGHIFYTTTPDNNSNRNLVRVDVTNPEMLTATVHQPNTDSVHSFVIGANHVLYAGHSSANQQQGLARLKKSNGGLFNLSSSIVDFWTRTDDHFCYIEMNETQVKCLAIDADLDVTTENYGAPLLTIMNAAAFNFELKFPTLQRTLLMDSMGSLYNGIEVENPTAEPRRIDLGFKTIKNAVASGSAYYVAGTLPNDQPALVKVDPLTDLTTPLFAAGTYDVFALSVGEDNEVLFSALRLSDGAKVLVKVDAAGALSVLDAELSTQVVVLTRIN